MGVPFGVVAAGGVLFDAGKGSLGPKMRKGPLMRGRLRADCRGRPVSRRESGWRRHRVPGVGGGDDATVGVSEVEFVDLFEFEVVGVGVVDEVVELGQVGFEVAAGVAGGCVGVVGVDFVGAGDGVGDADPRVVRG